MGNETNLENSLIKGISQGSLLYPSFDIVRFVLISYIVIGKITTYDEFFRSYSQQALAVNSILAALSNNEIMLSYISNCINGHNQF